MHVGSLHIFRSPEDFLCSLLEPVFHFLEDLKKKIFSRWSSDYFSLCAMTIVHASHWVGMCPEITSRVGLKGSPTFPPFARTCCNVKGRGWQTKRRIRWLRIVWGSGYWCIVFKLDYLHAILQSLHKHWVEIHTACVSFSICFTNVIIYSSALTLITGEKLCGRLFTNNYTILHPDILHPPSDRILRSVIHPKIHISLHSKLKRETFDAPGLKENPAQI